jgi:hypothetical protein
MSGLGMTVETTIPTRTDTWSCNWVVPTVSCAVETLTGRRVISSVSVTEDGTVLSILSIIVTQVLEKASGEAMLKGANQNKSRLR